MVGDGAGMAVLAEVGLEVVAEVDLALVVVADMAVADTTKRWRPSLTRSRIREMTLKDYTVRLNPAPARTVGPEHYAEDPGTTTVRVLTGVNAEMSSVDGPPEPVRGRERLEVFMRFPSIFFAKLPGCMLENLFSPNSPT